MKKENVLSVMLIKGYENGRIQKALFKRGIGWVYDDYSISRKNKTPLVVEPSLVEYDEHRKLKLCIFTDNIIKSEENFPYPKDNNKLFRGKVRVRVKTFKEMSKWIEQIKINLALMNL